MKQSKTHHKITHLLTHKNCLAHWTRPAGSMMPHPPNIFGHAPVTGAYNRFINPKIFTTVRFVEIKSLQKLNFFPPDIGPSAAFTV